MSNCKKKVENKEKPQVIAIIPARGGSKGIPRKNIKNLCGKPLIAYTIEVARKAGLIDRVVVSTEDEEIAEISKHYGAEVPFLRPVEMAQDRSNVCDALDFTIDTLRNHGCTFSILVTLFPTHVFRTPELMDFLIEKNLQGYHLVNTVKQVNHSMTTLFFQNGNKNLIPLFNSKKMNCKKIKPFFRKYGLYTGTGYNAKSGFYLHTIKDPAGLIDIDLPSDFILAEEVIKEGLFDFESKYLLDNPLGVNHH